MADKSIEQLIAAEKVNATDLFVLQQSGTAKKLTGQILENWLLSFADGHGGIQSITKLSSSGLVDTYRITLADATVFDFTVTNGRSINSITQTSVSGLTRTYSIAFNDGSNQTFTVTDGRSITGISKTSTSGLVDTYTIEYNDGTTSTFIVNNGEKGDKGDNAYVWIKYASQEPTESSHSIGDIPDDWMGVYSGNASTAPTDWKQYKWFKNKGEQGDTGSPATLVTKSVTYQVSDSGTIIPSGAWGSSIPVVYQGKYLWTKTELQFNTGEPIVSYSVARMGMDGTGSVSSVAGVSPDETGNVTLTAADVGALAVSGGEMTGAINMNGKSISGLNDPTEDTQAARKGYVDTSVRKAAPRNLLDNSDFRNPVNQRGSDYATGKASYPIDRWQYSYDGDTVRGGAGYDFTHKYLYLVNDSSNAGNTMIYHKITKEKLKTGKYTIAVRQAGTNLSIFILAYINGGALKSSTLTPNADGISLMAFEITEVQTDLTIYIYAAPNQTLTFSWAALYEGEYTAETLPEYQPKGYGAELVECHRYYREFTWLGGGNNFAPIRVMLPLPIPMRIANPTVTYKKTGGNGVVSIAMNGNDAVDITVSEDYATLRIYISADL